MAKLRYALSEPDIGFEEEEAALECLRSRWLSMGPRTKAFEEEFAALHGVKHGVAVANGTAALHLALLALDIGASPRDEVIQPSLSFVAAANMTCAVGAVPVFADIVSLAEPTIDPDQIEKQISPDTKAVVVMHYGGYPCRMPEIVELCRKRGIALIEDACHAPGFTPPEMGGRTLGAMGELGCFSFFSNKNLTCGEGGMIVTDRDDLAERLRSLRSHGMTTLSWDRHRGRASSYDVLRHGFNYRIDDLRSALAMVQLRKLPAANARRQELAERYSKAVKKLAGKNIDYVFGQMPKQGTAHIAAIIVDPSVRDDLRQHLLEQGIQTSLHYPPIHKFSSFEQTSAARLPLTEAFAECVITLPMYPGLPDEAPGEIIAACAAYLDNAQALETSSAVTELV